MGAGLFSSFQGLTVLSLEEKGDGQSSLAAALTDWMEQGAEGSKLGMTLEQGLPCQPWGHCRAWVTPVPSVPLSPRCDPGDHVPFPLLHTHGGAVHSPVPRHQGTAPALCSATLPLLAAPSSWCLLRTPSSACLSGGRLLIGLHTMHGVTYFSI